MDGRRSHAMTDEALDRELAAAFAVDHSPEFLARVRSRVAGEPVAPAWRRAWIAFAAPAIVIAVIALVWFRPPGQQPARTVARDVALTGPVLPGQAIAPLSLVAPAIVRRVGSRAPTNEQQTPREPEVLISLDEQRAFARLVQLIDEGQLPPDAVAPEAGVPDQALHAIEVVPIDAPPIEITPLDEWRRLE